MRALPHTALLALALTAGSFLSCANPVHTDAVAALGDEAPGVKEGPTHRPGQPCSTCHGGEGPGPDFAMAGTIYETRGVAKALPKVTVTLTDANGDKRTPVTNEVGNFYLRSEEWAPTYPVFATLSYADEATGKNVSIDMISRIGGNRGCAHCHYGADNEPSHMPPVFLRQK
jgi:hypothetical protein